MPPRVKISEIMDGLEMVGDETRTFLDRQTGKVISLMDDELRAAEDEAYDDAEADDGEEADDEGDDEPADKDEAPIPLGEWEKECVEQAKAVLAEDGTRFLPLPDRFDINEWEMMRDFATSWQDEDQAESLLNAIHGRGAFRCFKDRLHEFGLVDAWHKFRKEQYRQIAVEWCEAKGVEFDPDA